MRVANKGSGPAVIIHLLLNCPSCTVKASVGYKLRIYDTHTIIYLPYLKPGEGVKVDLIAPSPTDIKGIRATAWSPLGKESQYELENSTIGGTSTSEHKLETSMIFAALSLFITILFTAWLKLRSARGS